MTVTVTSTWWRSIPGVAPDALDVDVERNLPTVRAEQRPVPRADTVQTEPAEHPLRVFSRQIVLADTLDTERIEAYYDAGVPPPRIPIAERAKPRRISVNGPSGAREISG